LVTVESDIQSELATVEVQVFDAKGETPGGSFSFDLAKTGGFPVSLTVNPSAN
jgi:hypothetical protein